MCETLQKVAKFGLVVVPNLQSNCRQFEKKLLFQELCGSRGKDFRLVNQHSWHEMYALELGDVNPNSNPAKSEISRKNGEFQCETLKLKLGPHVTMWVIHSLIIILGPFLYERSTKAFSESCHFSPQNSQVGLFPPRFPGVPPTLGESYASKIPPSIPHSPRGQMIPMILSTKATGNTLGDPKPQPPSHEAVGRTSPFPPKGPGQFWIPGRWKMSILKHVETLGFQEVTTTTTTTTFMQAKAAPWWRSLWIHQTSRNQQHPPGHIGGSPVNGGTFCEKWIQ